MSEFHIRLNEENLIKFGKCIDIDKLWVGIVMHQLVQICNRIMVFKSSKSFVSALYYKNEWMELDKLSYKCPHIETLQYQPRFCQYMY